MLPQGSSQGEELTSIESVLCAESESERAGLWSPGVLLPLLRLSE
jgi:hypothetical protein